MASYPGGNISSDGLIPARVTNTGGAVIEELQGKDL